MEHSQKFNETACWEVPFNYALRFDLHGFRDHGEVPLKKKKVRDLGMWLDESRWKMNGMNQDGK